LITVVLIYIPERKQSAIGLQSKGTFWQEIVFGFRYIKDRPSLRSLTGLFMLAGIFLAVGATLMAPLVLSQTQNDESALAAVQSTGAMGGIIGGLLLSLWGGTQRRVHTVLLGGIGACLLGILWLGLSRALLFWAIGSFFFAFFEPFVEGGNLAIWQSKVEADVQGRVLSARQLLVQIPYLSGILIAGYLAEASALHNVLTVAGIAGALVFLFGYLVSHVRRAEVLLPDPMESL
jgi:hypothetical protein